MYKVIIKPFFDFSIGFIALIVLSPLLVLVTILLSIANKGNPFFFQPRPGKNGKIFRIVKFKTMTNERDVNGCLLPDSKRLTKVGKLIRKTSIDEIPQFWNILAGDMSLIGPRPLLVSYLPLYSHAQSRRHEVKPGITGWAQVNGRNTVSWDDKFKLDVWYVENMSFLLDLKIAIKTVKKVLASEGISAKGHETMPTFSEYLQNKNSL